MTGQHRGLTLVELAVVMAIIALAAGLLIPALAGARESTRQAVCGAVQQRLFRGAMGYARREKGWLPGVNTTGRFALGSAEAQEEMCFDSAPGTPTSVFDWISPSLGESLELPRNRAERTRAIFSRLACPSAGAMNDTLWGWAPDLYDEFLPMLEDEGFPQISYLSPAPFHLAGPAHDATRIRRYGWAGPAKPPGSYLPRLTRVGDQLSSKIFVADGTRYVNAEGLLDFDVDPSPDYYGSFTTSGPIYVASTAYGKRRDLALPGERNGREPFPEAGTHHNVDLSYRHRGRIAVTRFDGALGMLDQEASRADASPWYPSGSRFTGHRATEASLARYEEGDRLP